VGATAMVQSTMVCDSADVCCGCMVRARCRVASAVGATAMVQSTMVQLYATAPTCAVQPTCGHGRTSPLGGSPREASHRTTVIVCHASKRGSRGVWGTAGLAALCSGVADDLSTWSTSVKPRGDPPPSLDVTRGRRPRGASHGRWSAHVCMHVCMYVCSVAAGSGVTRGGTVS